MNVETRIDTVVVITLTESEAADLNTIVSNVRFDDNGSIGETAAALSDAFDDQDVDFDSDVDADVDDDGLAVFISREEN